MFKNKKVVVLNPIGVIPKKEESHQHGFEMMRATIFNGKVLTGKWKWSYTDTDLEVESPDIIVLSCGVNYNGSFNIIGGLSDEHAKRIIDLVNYVDNNPDVKIVNMIAEQLPQEKELLNRVGKPSTSLMFTQDVANKLVKVIYSAEYVPMTYFDTETITIGDSHTPAFTAYGNCFYHHNGATLFGQAIKRKLTDFVRAYIGKNTKTVEICLGSTDVRHHVFRETNIFATVEDFVLAYKAAADEVEKEFNVKVIPCGLMPIEHEERKLPVGNTFKGTNFTGTVEQRRQYTIEFNNLLVKHFGCAVLMPVERYHESPKDVADKFLEKPQSVHLRKSAYRAFSGDKWSR